MQTSRSDLPPDGGATAGADYARRLARLQHVRWKERLDVQRPYRWNVRRLNLGRTLDIGCGIGRNLAHLGGNGVGVDHNAASVAIAREAGHEAYTVDGFVASAHARSGAFDSILMSHLLEHITHDTALDITRQYLPFLRSMGRVVMICPQEKGWATDATHIRFVDHASIQSVARDLDLVVESEFSFPLPRVAGRLFAYNEFVSIARKV